MIDDQIFFRHFPGYTGVRNLSNSFRLRYHPHLDYFPLVFDYQPHCDWERYRCVLRWTFRSWCTWFVEMIAGNLTFFNIIFFFSYLFCFFWIISLIAKIPDEKWVSVFPYMCSFFFPLFHLHLYRFGLFFGAHHFFCLLLFSLPVCLMYLKSNSRASTTFDISKKCIPI